MQHKHAKVQYIKPDMEGVLYNGHIYHALGRDKNGFYYVKHESGRCDFFPADYFNIGSDIHGLLSKESLYFSFGQDDPEELLDNIDYSKANYYYGRHIFGSYTYVSKGRIVGFCHYKEHRGYITLPMLKERGCITKQCRYFEKNEEHPYWSSPKPADKRKTRKQMKAKIEEQERKLVEEAQECADFLGYNIKITSVRRDTENNTFLIYYISDLPENDYYRYINLARSFGGSKHVKTLLRHVKDIDGNYATFDSI